jgi:cellulose synthase operon protein C
MRQSPERKSPHRMPARAAVAVAVGILLGALLGACAGGPRQPPAGTPDNEPTIKTLAGREVAVVPDAPVRANEQQTIAAYRKFLEVAPNAPQRSEAMRRLGDLEMDDADERLASGQGGVTANGAPDYRSAISRYQDYLKAFPKDPGNDRVLYQLARAHELGGQLETSLATLDRLVAEYPRTHYFDEAQFRRGEMLFSLRDYARAEKAYATVLTGDQQSPFRERALYMQGWAMFKQGRLDDALQPFFKVLDLNIAGKGDADLESLAGLSREDRELVEDTFRVVSISLANLQGAESIGKYVDSNARRSYEFRVYQQLGELYLKQERVKDAADVFGAFARRQPLHAQAPQLQARVIDIYQGSGFGNLALEAKKDYVSRYGSGSDFRRANPDGWDRAQPLVKTHVTELARHYHASAQKSKASADYQEAVRWYRAYLTSFPKDPQAAQNNFLLAELLYEDKRFGEAAAEYEKAAYDYARHEKAADAGYAALLAYAGQEKGAAAGDLPALQRKSVDSALRFGKEFSSDARAGTVLTNASEKLFALGDGERAVTVAQQVLDLQPAAAPAQRRVAWTVVAHNAFERADFQQSERAYGEVLKLVPERDAARNEFTERLAASVYKQGEQARAAGRMQEAVGHFARVTTVAPQSAVRATAQYDAAAAMIGLKDWDGATRLLEDFRQRFANHPLQQDVSGKLAVAYVEKGQWTQAAGEFERLATNQKDPKVARDALWQAAELHEKAAEKATDKSAPRANAARTYERFVREYPQPLDTSMEARFRLARIARADGNAPRELALMKELFQADQAGGAARTNRTRFLGATAALALAEPAAAEYRKVALVEPLQKQLKLKKTKMEDALKAYGVAADYGVAEVTTAATFQTASLYQDFGRAMLESQRPKKLSKTELEQYNVLLEEQAFPFEEKAIELHEVNARRAADGIYDDWVRKSFGALAQLRPVRYGKTERGEVVIDAIR